MIKKIVGLIMIVLVIVCVNKTYAYSNDVYEIKLPEYFTESAMKNYFGDEEGNNVNIQTSEIKSGQEFQYSELFLNKLTDEMVNNIDDYKEEIKKRVTEQIKESVPNATDFQIASIVKPMIDSMKYNDFVKKEVTTFTKNNYPCLHYISDLSINDQNVYADTYQFVSGTTAYTLTIEGNSLDFLEKQEIKDMINSFTIVNYEKYAYDQVNKDSNNDMIIIALCAGGGVLVVLGIVIALFKKKKKGKEE